MLVVTVRYDGGRVKTKPIRLLLRNCLLRTFDSENSLITQLLLFSVTWLLCHYFFCCFFSQSQILSGKIFYNVWSMLFKFYKTQSHTIKQGVQTGQCWVTKQCLIVFDRRTLPVWTGLMRNVCSEL